MSKNTEVKVPDPETVKAAGADKDLIVKSNQIVKK